MKRLIYAFTWFWQAFTKPKVFQPTYFQTVASMMKFLEETAKRGTPMRSELRITKLAKILYDGQDRPFLHLWCGVNEIDNPLKRLADLAEENVKLREEISNNYPDVTKSEVENLLHTILNCSKEEIFINGFAQ
jgi:hypothetical protein